MIFVIIRSYRTTGREVQHLLHGYHLTSLLGCYLGRLVGALSFIQIIFNP